jgi:hypothetical protein
VDVVSVEGGIEQWGASGLPVVRGQKMISLERQVRITAGALTLGGVTLGYFVHPIGLGLGRAHVLWNHRHVWHGDASRPHALEQSQGLLRQEHRFAFGVGF